MYGNPYFIPGYYASAPAFNMMRGMMPFTGASRGLGIASRLGHNFGWLRNINWSGLINGASRTLGIVNQTIPIVKQVGPIYNNVRSMFRVMSAFRDETSSDNNRHITVNSNKSIGNSYSTENISNKQNYNNGPTFFTN